MSKLFDLLSRIISNVNALEQTNTGLIEDVDALRQDIAGIDIGGRIVTVEVDSLNTENLTSDKTFSEIEEAVLDGMNVQVKLICSGVNHHIYLQMTAHQQGSEIAFCGYFNNLPLVLRITADQ